MIHHLRKFHLFSISRTYSTNRGAQSATPHVWCCSKSSMWGRVNKWLIETYRNYSYRKKEYTIVVPRVSSKTLTVSESFYPLDFFTKWLRNLIPVILTTGESLYPCKFEPRNFLPFSGESMRYRFEISLRFIIYWYQYWYILWSYRF